MRPLLVVPFLLAASAVAQGLPPQGTRPLPPASADRIRELEQELAEAERANRECEAGGNPRACLRTSIQRNRARADLEDARAGRSQPGTSAPPAPAPAPAARPAPSLEQARADVRSAEERLAEAERANRECEAGGNPRACLRTSIQRNRAQSELDAAREQERAARTGDRRSDLETDQQVAEGSDPAVDPNRTDAAGDQDAGSNRLAGRDPETQGNEDELEEPSTRLAETEAATEDEPTRVAQDEGTEPTVQTASQDEEGPAAQPTVTAQAETTTLDG